MNPFPFADNVNYDHTRHTHVVGNQYNVISWLPELYGGRYPHVDTHIQQAEPVAPRASRRHHHNNANRASPMAPRHDYLDARGNQLDQVGGRIINHHNTAPEEIFTGDVVRHGDGAMRDSYRATHSPPPYQQDPPQCVSATLGSDVTLDSYSATLDSHSSTLDSHATSDRSNALYDMKSGAAGTKGQSSGNVDRFAAQKPRPNNPPFVSRYIVLQLDKEATRATLRKRKWSDEQIRVIDNMSDEKYVGYIVKPEHSDDDPEVPPDPTVFRVYLLRQGLPAKSLTSDMCVAVQPNTDETCLPRQEKQHDHHEHHRKALSPVNPLPWENCYHSSFENLLVRIPSLSKDTGDYELPHGERIRHEGINGKDFYNLVVRQKKLRAKIHANEPMRTRTPSPEPLLQEPRVTLWEVMDEAVMSVRATPLKYHYVEYLPQLPDPAKLMEHQKNLIQTKNHGNMVRESETSAK